mmetsp:Transcript_84623/g.218083  ORF Transcript_84623/g.218083 Transcript_84623/m.218083 type:complete len:150 (+) Transcript_84623:130-579(+)
MAKRKRHKVKADLSKVKATFTKKRGRLVMNTEVELKRTTAELQAEIEKLKQTKKDLRLLKKRHNRAPAPIKDRKALDHDPVDAGLRRDKEARAKEKAARREAVLARRERLRAKKEAKARRGGEEVDISATLGKDFFTTEGDGGAAAAAK